MAAAADGAYDKYREFIYKWIDTLNVGRNALSASTSICLLTKAVAVGALAGAQATSALLLAGCGTLYISVSKGIPEAREAREKSQARYQEIIAKKRKLDTPPSSTTANPLGDELPLIENEGQIDRIRTTSEKQKSSFEKLLWCVGEIIASFLFIEFIAAKTLGCLYYTFNYKDKDILDKDEQSRIAGTKLWLNSFNEINWSHMIRIGVLQIGLGITSILSTGPIANFFGYAGCIALNTATFIATVLGGALGITYILRGGAVIYRARENRKLMSKLRQEIQEIYQTKNIPTQEKAKLIKERLETYCTTDKEGNVDLLQALVKSTHTEDIIAPELGNIDILNSISKTNDDAVLKGYLEKLDKGLHRKIVEFEIAESLGWAMLAGGILTMVAVFTTGCTALSITLVSSIVFLYLEGTFVLYDSSDWFDAYQRDLYKTPGWLLAPSELGTVEVAPEDASDQDRLIDKGTPHQTPQKQLTLGRCVSLFLTALPRTIHYLYE